MNVRCSLRFLWFGALLVVLPSCGRSRTKLPLVPVTGVLKINGSGARGVEVTFIPRDDKGFTATGRTGEDGQFALTCRGNPGALPGEYAVTLAPSVDPADWPKDKSRPPVVIFPEYVQRDKTPLTRAVPAGGGTIDLDVTMKPGR
jgi:hypothetical protein